MTTKTTDLWLSRDPDGSYWVSEQEPRKFYDGAHWVWAPDEGLLGEPQCPLMSGIPFLRKGTKRRVRITVEVLR